MEASAHKDPGTLLIAYEESHLERIIEEARAREGSVIVALDAWTERALSTRGVAFHSFSTHVLTGEALATEAAHAAHLARDWYRLPSLAFFTHEGIRIGEVLEPMLVFYLGTLSYYVRGFESVLRSYPGAKLVVPHSTRRVSPGAGPFASFEVNAVADGARAAARSAGTTIEFFGTAAVPPTVAISGGPFLMTLAFSIYNALIGLAPERPVKVFASEYWSHISPFLASMPDVSLTLMDRKEIRAIPLSMLWKHRVRFVHPVAVRNARVRRMARDAVRGFREQWASARPNVEVLFEGLSAAMPALEYAVTRYAERIVADTEAVREILTATRADKALLRASIGGRQHHFFLIAQIARMLGIPAIELQHAIEVADPGTVHSKLASEYLAAYGTQTRLVLSRNHGYAPQRILPIGSPRFDRYLDSPAPSGSERASELSAFGLDPARPVVFVGMPPEIIDLYFVHFDSYGIRTFLESLAELKRDLPNIQFIFKFRPKYLSNEYRALIEELFGGEGVALAEYEDAFRTMQLADMVISGNSTLITEAMLAARPVILYPLQPHDTFLAPGYGRAVRVPRTLPELRAHVTELLVPATRDAQVREASDYLGERYSFDGKASSRMQQLLREPLPLIGG